MEIVADSIEQAALLATCHKDAVALPDIYFDKEKCVRIWPGTAKSLAYLLAAQGTHETNFAQHVHEGRCRAEAGECDARRRWDRKKKAYVYTVQSVSPWQLKLFRDIPVSHWDQMSAVEGTHYAAWYAARRLSSAYRACGSIKGSISRYARGNGCWWEGAKERVETYTKISNEHPDTKKRMAKFWEKRVAARIEETKKQKRLASSK